jgi:[acyl-carrier-protein] S-malonyltransferase
MAEAMQTTSWSDPEVPMAANYSGELVTTADDVRRALIEQIASPVRWVDCVQTLAKSGCTGALEFGPGRVLSGLVRQIEPAIEVSSVDSPAKLEELATSRPDLVRT